MYENMLESIRVQMKRIEQISLDDVSFNDEWRQLAIIEGSLLRLLKIYKARGEV